MRRDLEELERNDLSALGQLLVPDRAQHWRPYPPPVGQRLRHGRNRSSAFPPHSWATWIHAQMKTSCGSRTRGNYGASLLNPDFIRAVRGTRERCVAVEADGEVTGRLLSGPAARPTRGKVGAVEVGMARSWRPRLLGLQGAKSLRISSSVRANGLTMRKPLSANPSCKSSEKKMSAPAADTAAQVTASHTWN